MSEVITVVTNYALASMEYYKGQRDKLLEALRMMVNGKTTYVDDERNTSCVYCEQWVNFRHEYDPIIVHTEDCPWALAKAIVVEIEAQIAKEAK